MECAAYINSIALEKESVSVQYCVSARASEISAAENQKSANLVVVLLDGPFGWMWRLGCRQ